ncbi:hypothetical protein PF005_g26727 [Phytophthora fragariae]|uniref:Uncharacterized protein n=1 Tax=Phytophthora fragariae TaxID=53985 RepID=A0A6A3VRZ4_9STRA|nr:hypothetical protein PF010_g25976 [Phytophthora fragariae]KAE9172408.1 hypothetical protein PF005_g26727 [Phytophthora fragariae]
MLISRGPFLPWRRFVSANAMYVPSGYCCVASHSRSFLSSRALALRASFSYRRLVLDTRTNSSLDGVTTGPVLVTSIAASTTSSSCPLSGTTAARTTSTTCPLSREARAARRSRRSCSRSFRF